MATDLPFFARRQTPSHWFSCGQTRPVTHGSALSSSSESAAPGRSPSRRSLRNRGMLTLTGQPPMQYGFGHCRQRSASSMAIWQVSPRLTSRKFTARTAGSCSGMTTRSMAIRSFCAERGTLIGHRTAASVVARWARPGMRQASWRASASCSNAR